MTPVTWRRVWPFIATLPLAGTTALLMYGRQFERHHLRDRQIEISVPGLSPAFDGYRIVQLSDFHAGGRAWSPRTLTRAVELALRQRANLIALTGDFVETTAAIAPCLALLARLHAQDGVVAVLGNHDYADRSIRVDAVIQALREIGALVLRNQSYCIHRGDDNLWILGIDDAYSGHAYLPSALSDVPRSARPVVLSHYPDFAWQLGASRWAVVLSGHAHGSQVRLPLIARYAREIVARTRFSHGLYDINGTPVFVSTGIGTSGRPLRIMARPEVATIVLRAAALPHLA